METGACDDLDRKSASGGYLMVGGCPTAQSQQDDCTTRALSSGESEIMSMSSSFERSQTDAVQFGVLWDGASSDCPAH